MGVTNEQWKRLYGEAQAEIGRLRLALEPFVKAADEAEAEAEVAFSVGGYVPIDMPELSIDGWAASGITWQDLLNARAAVNGRGR